MAGSVQGDGLLSDKDAMKSGNMQLMNTPAFPSPDRTPAAQIETARQLVLRHGWNSTSYQIINPGIHRWFDEPNDAVVGFVPGGRVRVVAGAPHLFAGQGSRNRWRVRDNSGTLGK